MTPPINDLLAFVSMMGKHGIELCFHVPTQRGEMHFVYAYNVPQRVHGKKGHDGTLAALDAALRQVLADVSAPGFETTVRRETVAAPTQPAVELDPFG